MANSSFNSLNKIDNINIGSRIPVDSDTLALWIFDGSEIDGKIRDWSGNENHLIPNQPLKYEYAPFGKVLKNVEGLSFTSEKTTDVVFNQPRTMEILFSTNIENYDADGNPYTTVSGIDGENIGSFITSSSRTAFYFGTSLCIKDDGTIQILELLDENIDLFNEDQYLDFSSSSNRFHNTVSSVSGDSYPHPLYPKNWIGLAIPYPSQGEAFIEYRYWLNGVETVSSDNNLGSAPFGGAEKFKLFPFPAFSQTKNVAFIRLSKKIRTGKEVNNMLQYFSSSDGNISNLKLYDRPLGKYRLLNESAECALTREVSFDYKLPRFDFEYVRSGVTSSQQDVYQNVRLVYSGLPVFDYNEIGASKGLVIEQGKENYFKYADGSFQSDFGTGTFFDFASGNPSFVAPFNFDPCTKPVHGDYYGYSGPDGFHYWNMTKELINSGVYTMSCWVKKTSKVSDLGFLMTLSRSSVYSDVSFVGQRGEVIDAHPLFDNTDHASNQLRFRFKSGEHYTDWQRLWVTFKIYLDGYVDKWQFTHDNQTWAGKGAGDVFALDCHQFEEGWLSSWKPEYIQTENPGDTYFSMDLSKYITPNAGTIIFDYYNYNTYSGITNDYVSILKLGSNTTFLQEEDKIYFDDPTFGNRLLGDCKLNQKQTLAVGWDFIKGQSYAAILNDDGTITLPANPTTPYPTITDFTLTALSGTTLSGISYRVDNLKVFNRQLSLDELGTYN